MQRRVTDLVVVPERGVRVHVGVRALVDEDGLVVQLEVQLGGGWVFKVKLAEKLVFN